MKRACAVMQSDFGCCMSKLCCVERVTENKQNNTGSVEEGSSPGAVLWTEYSASMLSRLLGGPSTLNRVPQAALHPCQTKPDLL